MGLITPHLYSTVGSYYLDVVEPYCCQSFLEQVPSTFVYRRLSAPLVNTIRSTSSSPRLLDLPSGKGVSTIGCHRACSTFDIVATLREVPDVKFAGVSRVDVVVAYQVYFSSMS